MDKLKNYCQNYEIILPPDTSSLSAIRYILKEENRTAKIHTEKVMEASK